SQKKSPAVFLRWGIFVGCWLGIGYLWLVVLPRESASEESQQQWIEWNEKGIDPSATYYSELECHTRILSRWKEQQARHD
ncbi:MAG: hypothetical protein KDA65_14100, partial [Planctomycetaceae bacterium]|nr:hypothetical protein [Planctomycetaceae bacterium]